MNPLLDLLGGGLDATALRRLGSQIGASPEQAGTAAQTALPLLLGALQRNTAGGGASSLLAALDRDHDGSVLDDLAGFLGQGPSPAGGRSLDHIFGGRRTAVESAVSRASGLDGGKVAQLLAMLAPMVLGALGKVRRQSGADAGGLGELLGGAVGSMQQQTPGIGGLLGGLLDADGDGSVVDDLLEKGLGGGKGGLGGLLGGLLGGRR